MPTARPAHPGPRVGIVVPVRSFRHGKGRLARVLDDDARVALARDMANAVIGAARGRPTVVVSSDPEVAAWCAAHGIDRIDDPGSLDASADAGRRWARARGLPRVAIVHADLPFASTLDALAVDDERVAVVVPDHREDGTPALSVPSDAPFRFAYGPGSFARHVTEAERCGLVVSVVRDAALAFDVDVPEDLEHLRSRSR
ncbi:MAG: hypothetical protein KatS3mg010_1688 [Acidimicrobiia bacterium]|nr:MAG: hypothetical protein KatS3mg010_1688 [Acidimicrobiia bacterium]